MRFNMPIDLRRESVNDFLISSEKQKSILDFIKKLDSSDEWTIDFQDDEESQEVIREMELVFSDYGHVLHLHPEKIIYFISNLTTSRCLFIIKVIGDRFPELLKSIESSLLRHTRENESDVCSPADIVVQRFDVVDRARLLQTIYSVEVYQRITKLLS